MNIKKIYLDHAATTPVDKKALKAMLPYFSENFGNAMSLHSFGREAEEAVDTAREIVSNFLNCENSEIVFTSGATEANNFSIKGAVKSFLANPKFKGQKPHIITTAFEHHCVLDTCKSLEKDNLAEITYIKPDKEGLIDPEDVKKTIKRNTILVSVMYVNNEIGTIAPIEKIGKIIKDLKKKKYSIYPLFHTDATQAVNYLNCNVEKLGVDLLSFSGHKIYGPKGIGALYLKRRIPIRRIQDGGDQEGQMRAGTHNVPGIVGLGKAISLVNKKDSIKIKTLRDYLMKKVLQEIPETKLNGSTKFRSPANLNFSFLNVEGEGLILSLDMEGIACSTGSACSSGALEPSHVLLAIGKKPEETQGSLRISLGKTTTKKEIDIFILKLKEIINRLREISGNILKEYYDPND